jgi:hypothetical protein
LLILQGKNEPIVQAAGLWAPMLIQGGQYLAGRLGGVKVLILDKHERQGDDEPSHHGFFAEAPDRRQGGQNRGYSLPPRQIQ